MKSFNNLRSENLAVWLPPDLESETQPAAKDVQKRQVLSLFNHPQKNANPAANAPTSVLHLAGASRQFCAWQPDLMGVEPTQVEPAAWEFIDLPEYTPGSHTPEKILDTVAKSEPIKPEYQVEIILEGARIQAEEIILSAQSAADEVLLQAQSEINDQKKEGYQQGQKEARLELEESVQALHLAQQEVTAWKASLMAQGEQILVEMLKEISKKMFGDGIELDKKALQTNLSRIMESASGLGSLHIFLNPKDARNLDSAWVDQYLLVTGGQAKIVPSENITRGGCYVKGNMGTVDGRVETQLDAFLKTFDEVSAAAE
jgi:flagellar biosynthesis/type III secretory pathway protein FliH